MVNVENLTVKYGSFTAVKDVSFSVNKSEIFGFLGANGAGKTTTIRVLCGLLHPTFGKVKVAGVTFDKHSSDSQELQIKQNVGYMSQKFTLYNDLTVKENLEFIASLRKLDYATYIKRRDYLLKFISFRHSLNALVRDLPGGINQQVSLAAAILHDPEIIFLDEPTAGVTPATRSRFWELIKNLVSQGKTVFVTTHYMDEAEQCGRVALMSMGKIVALDSPDNLKRKIFSDKLYEIEIKDNNDYLRLRDYKAEHPELDYFEPFGLHFHVAFKDSKEAKQLKKNLSEQYELKEITPTLEDVFIKKIESEHNDEY